MSYVLTIHAATLEELDNVVMSLRGKQVIAAVIKDKTTADGYTSDPVVVTKGSGDAVATPKITPGKSSARPAKDTLQQDHHDDDRSQELTYVDVKNAVLEVAKTKGREASLNLLAEFNSDEISVVTGAGADRKGNIDKLKPHPELWGKVIARASEISA